VCLFSSIGVRSKTTDHRHPMPRRAASRDIGLSASGRSEGPVSRATRRSWIPYGYHTRWAKAFLLSKVPYQGQRSWPATSLIPPAALLPVRPFRSTTRSPVLAGSDCFLASGPLQFPRPASPAAHLLPLPFGTFQSRWINASASSAAFRSAFRFRPISSHSPQPFR
jgi:hypothetical protein